MSQATPGSRSVRFHGLAAGTPRADAAAAGAAEDGADEDTAIDRRDTMTGSKETAQKGPPAERPGAVKRRQGSLHDSMHTGRVWRMNKDQWRELTERHFDAEMLLEMSSTVSGCGQMTVNPMAAQSKPGTEMSMYASARLHREKRRSICGLPVMDPNSRVPRVWTAFMMGVDLTYTAFIVPVSVGYATDQMSGVLGWFDFMAGWVFLAALVMGFNIGYVAQYKMQRLVVLNGPDAARYYMRRGTFVVDLVSAAVYLPQVVSFVLVQSGAVGNKSQLASGAAMHLVQLLRMVRLLALVSMFRDLLLAASTGGSKKIRQWLKPSVLYIIVISYLLAWVINSAAALWFYVGCINASSNRDNWIASYLASPLIPDCYLVTFDWQDAAQEVPEGCAHDDGTVLAGVPSLSFMASFMLCIYYSVTTMTTVGYGDITPSNAAESAVAIIVMMTGIMTFAVLIGSMQEVFKSASDVFRNSAVLRQKLEDVDRWMLSRNIPSHLKSQIRRFYHEEWAQVGEAELEVQVFEELPPALRGSVACELTSSLLAGLPCFRGLTAEQRKLVAAKLLPLSVCCGADLCHQGEDAESLWILQEGRIVVLYGNDVEATESAPTTLGETAVLASVDEQFSTWQGGYRAVCSCFLWELRMRDLRALMKQRPDIAQSIQASVADIFVARAEQCNELRHMDLCLLRESFMAPKENLHDGSFSKEVAVPELSAGSVAEQDSKQPLRVTGFGDISMEGVMNVMRAARKLQRHTSRSDEQSVGALGSEETSEAYQGPGAQDMGPDSSQAALGMAVGKSRASRTDELLQEVLSQMKGLHSRMSQVERTLRRGTHVARA